ncbi:hypothetical protein FISHEDRAFT_48487 [Fistulina hepatica ATCC 64428]|uniref:Uncharacterized protein n=1 Tax=Fistulina hepatica ATCC 64428 TaxID=1128425 RepID=A0A0D7A6F9_9AGAR|nr:hypothetical protein FISHEDRAFT_48487 [Fistulina hepatica ATCC 64428]
MGIKPMPWDRWYELDDRYIEYQTIRKRRLKERGSDVVCVLDDSNPLLPYGRCKQAAVEVLLDTANYLVQRYPSTFKLAFVGSIHRVEVLPTQEHYTLPSSLWVDNGDGLSMRSVSKEEAEQALVTLGALVQDDIAIMEEGMDGKYYFQAGLICVPGFWRMKDKIGLKLEDIHIAGNVPQYKEKLLLSLDRYFRRMRVDRPIIRHNYGGQVVNVQDPDVDDPEELAWSVTTNGMEDTYRPGHAHQPPEGLPLDVRPQALRIRSERQTLRRLPGSGCIVFGIRTYLYQVPTLCTEREGEIPESREWEGPEGKHVKDRLVSAVKSWPEEVRHYKGAKLYEDTIYNL